MLPLNHPRAGCLWTHQCSHAINAESEMKVMRIRAHAHHLHIMYLLCWGREYLDIWYECPHALREKLGSGNRKWLTEFRFFQDKRVE